jgi:cell division protein FtsW (lipid II flippase)
MEQKAKDQFRMKFYRLAVQLNIIILLVVVPVLFLFIFPSRFETFRYPVIAVMLLAALILAINFRTNYHETRAWLHEQPDKKEEG